jgi:hypothetical protein
MRHLTREAASNAPLLRRPTFQAQVASGIYEELYTSSIDVDELLQGPTVTFKSSL